MTLGFKDKGAAGRAAVFLFLGPTGVGENGTHAGFHRPYFWYADKLVRYDMSEFQTQESLGLLLGSRPGEKGFLGAAYERTQTGTLLFDEVCMGASAHHGMFFLQMLDAAPRHELD